MMDTCTFKKKHNQRSNDFIKCLSFIDLAAKKHKFVADVGRKYPQINTQKILSTPELFSIFRF